MKTRDLILGFTQILETSAMDCQDDSEVVVSGIQEDGDDLLIELEGNDGSSQMFRLSPKV